MVRPWPILSSAQAGDYGIFRIRKDRCTSPRTGASHDFSVIECVDWVNVVALTPDEQVVMIEQYRFGSQTVTLEIPGGMIDPGETPVEAALRELQEETGYTAARLRLLGHVEPNPAIINNRCYTVLAEQCTPSAGQALDEKEDISVLLHPLASVPRMLADGRIGHALVWAAFHHLELWRRGLLPTES